MSYLESEAICPYFDNDSAGIIKCEIGNLRIMDNQMKREVGYGLCASKYGECPFKVALDHYWERQEASEEKKSAEGAKQKIRVYKEPEFTEAEMCDGEQLEWF